MVHLERTLIHFPPAFLAALRCLPFILGGLIGSPDSSTPPTGNALWLPSYVVLAELRTLLDANTSYTSLEVWSMSDL
jgi:hypothetical protein